MMNYSIIIPHYNIPELLQRCLDSLPMRDDVEVIIVDDNSDATKVDFDHFPGKDRPNTHLILSKENKGGGYARNIGIQKAQGKWLIFADADDFFTKELANILEEYKADTDMDVAYFDAISVDTDSLQPAKPNRAVHLNEFIQQWKDGDKMGEINLRYFFGEPWAKFVKRDLVLRNAIRFDETKIHNDTTFAYLIGHAAKAIKVDTRAIYTITVRAGSVSVTKSDDRILTRIQVLSKANKFYLDHQIPVCWKWLYKQLADLYLFDRKLYHQGLKIVEQEGLSLKDTKKHILQDIPKALARKLLHR